MPTANVRTIHTRKREDSSPPFFMRMPHRCHSHTICTPFHRTSAARTHDFTERRKPNTHFTERRKPNTHISPNVGSRTHDFTECRKPHTHISPNIGRKPQVAASVHQTAKHGWTSLRSSCHKRDTYRQYTFHSSHFIPHVHRCNGGR